MKKKSFGSEKPSEFAARVCVSVCACVGDVQTCNGLWAMFTGARGALLNIKPQAKKTTAKHVVRTG